MSLAERKQLTELCVKFAAGRVPVIVGAGSTSTAEAVELAAHAAATAVMVVPPFYDPVNLEQLTELMAEIHGASQLPIMYYNIPSASGLTLSPKEMAGFSKVGIKYLKDTSGNAPAFTELVFGLSDQITACNGWDSLTFYGFAAGCPGGVWGAANFIPELAVELYNVVSIQGDLKRGRELWTKVWPICNFLEFHNYAAAVKTGVELTGQPTGGLRKLFALLLGSSDRAETSNEECGVKTV